ncbi:hypothetical protein XENOCAPTIV_008206 [Xenoophorus captivus]|uniref:Uncharacterized protein n=1 Tax=Xenoophorus captivus TaxID=1517983 RepID=A0ABV0QQM6_9TELE
MSVPKSRSKLRDLSGDPSNRAWTLDLLFPAGCRIGRFLTASGEPCPPSSIPPKTAQLRRLSVARCLLQDHNLSPWWTYPNLTVSSLAE